MGVPPTSRQRMAIDRDANGVLDGDEVPPTLTAVRSGTGIVISWPTNSVGAVLEFSASLSPPSWKTETGVRSHSADRFIVTIPINPENRFYRLRRL